MKLGAFETEPQQISVMERHIDQPQSTKADTLFSAA